MTWTVHIHDAAARQLETIPPDRRKRILDDLFAFEQDPFRGLVKPLKGKEHKGKYRKVSGRDGGRSRDSASERADISVAMNATHSARSRVLHDKIHTPITGNPAIATHTVLNPKWSTTQPMAGDMIVCINP